MAVFTEVSFDEARSLVERLDIGALQRLAGITAGIENTNYFVTTDRGEYVLTLFERLNFEQLPFYLHFMKHLAGHGVPVPDPEADAQGEILHTLNGKPAALVNKLARRPPARAGRRPLRAGGRHAGAHAPGRPRLRHAPAQPAGPAPGGSRRCREVLPHVTPEQAALLESELEFQRTLAASPAFAALPRGPIHADLFRDNVMFEGPPGEERLTGFFDFYFAGVDTFLFDVAVCLNDWCIDLDSGRLVEERAAAFVAAYGTQREWDSAEYRLLPALMRAAAFRFWLSRLWDLHLPRSASLLKAHDPEHFERVLRERIARPWHPAVA